MLFGHMFCSFDENFQSWIEEIEVLNLVDQHFKLYFWHNQSPPDHLKSNRYYFWCMDGLTINTHSLTLQKTAVIFTKRTQKTEALRNTLQEIQTRGQNPLLLLLPKFCGRTSDDTLVVRW